MFRVTSIMFVIGVALSSPASAATTILSVTPEVSVNHGQGFKAVVTASTAASVGDRVMVSPGGHGRIVYSDGCAIDVYPGAIVTVQASCKLAGQMKPMLLGEGCDPKELNCGAAIPGTPWWVYGAAGALIAGTVCLGACQTTKSASP